jgi:predicted translin family RNA/ssDNA-binding protein
MADARAEVSKIVHESRNAIEEAHRKLSAMAEVDKQRLSHAVEKLKSAHKSFEDDAQEFVTH